MPSVILKIATRLMVGLMLVFSVYLLLRGHHEPGGGFAAALVAGTAFALFAISDGPRQVRHAIRVSPLFIAASGLSIATLSGCLSLLAGQPFLTGLWWFPAGNLAIGTPLIFDIGVFLAVLGAILSLLLALEEL